MSASISAYMLRCPAPRPTYFNGTSLPSALASTPLSFASSSAGSASAVSESRSISTRSSSTFRATRNLPDVASNRMATGPFASASAPPRAPRKIDAAAASVACPQSATSSFVVNHRMPSLNVVPVLSVSSVPPVLEGSMVFSSCGARGAMKTVIGWLKLAAIVCNVSSGSALSDGRCTTAAGFPPSSRSVNAFSMLKGSVWEQVSIVISRKLCG